MLGYFLFILVIVITVSFIVKKIISKRESRKGSDNNIMTLDDKYNSKKVEREKEMDRILDKIGRRGYNSLSKKEKKFLDKYSGMI